MTNTAAAVPPKPIQATRAATPGNRRSRPVVADSDAAPAAPMRDFIRLEQFGGGGNLAGCQPRKPFLTNLRPSVPQAICYAVSAWPAMKRGGQSNVWACAAGSADQGTDDSDGSGTVIFHHSILSTSLRRRGAKHSPSAQKKKPERRPTVTSGGRQSPLTTSTVFISR